MSGFLTRLVTRLRALPNAMFTDIACAQCASHDREVVLRRDRYLLPVEIAVCSQCALVYTSRNIAGEALLTFYREHYRRYYENACTVTAQYRYLHHHQLNAAFRFARIRDVAPAMTGVFELGCGLGYFLDECRSGGVRQLCGIELGDVFRQFAQQALGLGPAILGMPYEQITALPFAPDLVVLFHVFEHLEDPRGFLRWLAPKLAPNATLVIEVPDITGDWRDIGLTQFHTAHRWYFSPVTLANMLAAEGFTPWLMTRDDGDGIYPGNLRVFARREPPPAFYPLAETSPHASAAGIRARLRLGSWRNGYPRAVLRQLAGAWRGG